MKNAGRKLYYSLALSALSYAEAQRGSPIQTVPNSFQLSSCCGRTVGLGGLATFVYKFNRKCAMGFPNFPKLVPVLVVQNGLLMQKFPMQ